MSLYYSILNRAIHAAILPEGVRTVSRYCSFGSFDEVSEFFRKGDCGFSCSLRGDELEGLQLKTLKWEMVPMEVESQRCAFYSDSQRFPAGSLDFDCGLLMRGFLTSGTNSPIYLS